MSPNVYNKIKRLMSQHDIRSLTVDVCDTILLYDYWPADLRYYDIVAQWLPIVNRLISDDITVYELYDWRMSTKQMLDRSKMPSRIDIWFDVMLDALCSKYKVKLTPEQKLELLTTLITVELQFELMNSKPNEDLVEQLKKIKQEFPSLKIYFLTDSHLTSDQVQTILDIHQVEIFDGGLSSAEFNETKSSGELYERLVDDFGAEFNLAKNIHIGDERQSDFKSAIQHDSLAIHYRPLRMRGMRTMVGENWMRCLKKSAQVREVKKRVARDVTLASWSGYGKLLAEIRLIWCWTVTRYAKMYDGADILLLGEASKLQNEGDDEIALRPNIYLTPEITKKSVLQAFVWLLTSFRTTRWDAKELLKILMKSENLSRSALYELCFESDYEYSKVAFETFTDEEFSLNFLNEVLQAEEKFTQTIRESYANLSSVLAKKREVSVMVQVNEDGTLALFRQFAQLHGVDAKIIEVTLDKDNVVLDIMNRMKPLLNKRRSNEVNLNLKEFCTLQDHLRESELSPENYLQDVLLPELKKISGQLIERVKF